MSTEIFSAIYEHCQPPQVETPFKSPPAETHYKPPSTVTHSQPPTSETHFQPPTGYTVNKHTDLVEHTFVGDSKVYLHVFSSDVYNYQGYFIKFQPWLEHTPFYYCSLFFFKYYKQVFGFHIFSIFL
jgi:hypothetical protein